MKGANCFKHDLACSQHHTDQILSCAPVTLRYARHLSHNQALNTSRGTVMCMLAKQRLPHSFAAQCRYSKSTTNAVEVCLAEHATVLPAWYPASMAVLSEGACCIHSVWHCQGFASRINLRLSKMQKRLVAFCAPAGWNTFHLAVQNLCLCQGFFNKNSRTRLVPRS